MHAHKISQNWEGEGGTPHVPPQKDFENDCTSTSAKTTYFFAKSFETKDQSLQCRVEEM